MWENFIGQQIRRCNQNLLIANLVLLGASVTYASMFDYGEDGWWMLGMAVPLPLLATWNLSRWKKRVGDYTCHPICKRLARFGTVEQVIQQIETAILTNPVKKIAGVTLFGPWLFKKSFFGLKCFRIPRMKPAKGSQCRNKVAILGIRLCRPSILIAGLASVALAQSAPTRRDIPTIAKSAKEAMVTIVTGNNDEPIALGSGFLVSSDGAIATNYHVIASGNVAVVKFADGMVLPVDGVLAIDKVHDLAIVKVHGKTFQTLTLGNSDQIQVGEEVVAIGNPLGLELTVSNGILSGVRITKEEGKFLQTTAPISHGSSGGPLFNMFGEVVGVNTLYLEGGHSLNFAIPVNDVKNLLHNQSTQLQQLPNEVNPDKPEPHALKPDAPTALPSDAASPKENELGIAAPSPKTPSYYIRAYQHGAYIIDYNGRQLAATCREALSWLDGPDKLGRPMTEHECMYINDKVGKYIAAAQIWRGDKELRYEPLGQDKADVADVLDIIAEAPIGSPLRRPSPKTSPEILKTLHWIQNTLADKEGTIIDSAKDGKASRGVNLLPDVNGCQVTFVYSLESDWKETFRTRQQVNLGDLDPTSIEVDEASFNDILGRPVSYVWVHTTDKLPTIRLTVNDRSWQPAMFTSTELSWELPGPYAARFAKALKQAIALCGGKTSSF
jgi:hypothetical protein